MKVGGQVIVGKTALIRNDSTKNSAHLDGEFTGPRTSLSMKYAAPRRK